MKQTDRVVDVLELLADSGQMSLAEVAASLGVSRPTAYRLLAGLQARGYVEHLPLEHGYRLGPAIRALAARSAGSLVTRLAERALADLRASTGETVNLALVRRGRIVYAAILDGVYALRLSGTVGQEVPPHATALGKSMLAATAPEQRDLLLGSAPYRAFTPNTLTEREALERELQATRARGYAIDREEMDVGAVCIAAPIVAGDGRPIAALSVSAVAARFPEERWSPVGRAVKRWADEISAELGLPETLQEAEG